MKIAKLKFFIASVLISNTAFACFVPDGSYEKSNYFLLAAIFLLAVNLVLSRGILRRRTKKSLLVAASVLVFPVYYYAIKYNICCDCGHGMLLGAQLLFVASILLLCIGVYFTSVHNKSLKSDAASGAA